LYFFGQVAPRTRKNLCNDSKPFITSLIKHPHWPMAKSMAKSMEPVPMFGVAKRVNTLRLHCIYLYYVTFLAKTSLSRRLGCSMLATA
jgi:hypothetical protein